MKNVFNFICPIAIVTIITSVSLYAQEFNQIQGKVIEAKTTVGIPYAHVLIRNSPMGTVANSEGEFQLNVENGKRADYVVFSSIGYAKDSVLLSSLIEQKNVTIQLKPTAIELSAVEISSKKLVATEIISEVVKRIKDNYHQGAFNQELFYRTQVRYNDSVTFNEEAAVLTYSKKGYQPKSKAYDDMFGKVLQLRNTTNNRSVDEWFGTGSLWKVFTHDLILDKNNLLHKTSAYSLEITNVLDFDGETVYEITFTCKNPSALTTGFGFPDPEATNGRLYVNEADYSILKYEHCIKRKPYDYKNSKLRAEDWTVVLIQSYKKNGDKYFLHHSKQIHNQNLRNIETNAKNRVTEIYDLISTDVNTSSPEVINAAIDRLLKGYQLKVDPIFWKQHNIVLEDKNFTMGCKW